MLVKHYNVYAVFVHMKIFILNKITYYIVKLLNLRNIPIKVRKILYTIQDVVVWKENQNINFKEKLLKLLSAFFHIFKQWG